VLIKKIALNAAVSQIKFCGMEFRPLADTAKFLGE